MEQIQPRSQRRACGLALQALAFGAILTAAAAAVVTLVNTPKWETELILDIEPREKGGPYSLEEWFLTVSSTATLREAAESLTGGKWSRLSDADKLLQLSQCVEIEGGHDFSICVRPQNYQPSCTVQQSRGIIWIRFRGQGSSDKCSLIHCGSRRQSTAAQTTASSDSQV
jgi:hypothetical protein